MRLHHQSFNIVSSPCNVCKLSGNEYELRIPSESINLSIVRNFVREFGNCKNLSERETFDIQIAVGEATANAIEHGSPYGPANSVTLIAGCNGTQLTIVIRDEGTFLRRMPAPDVDMDFRGRGIPLMLALMDKVTIDEATEGTTVILEKKMNASHPLEDESLNK